jgi:uncharacterized protein YcbK (DUF882 family)
MMAHRDLSDHFAAKEFFCKCGICMDQVIDIFLVGRLQILRDTIGEPIKITSGYRCERHNTQIKGSPNSQHLQGKAADIYVIGMDPSELAGRAYINGFKGIGVASNFVHVDTRTSHNVKLWSYPGVDLKAIEGRIKRGGIL